MLQKIKIKQDNQEKEFLADGLFLAIGHRPVSQLFVDQIELDEKGYIVTRQDKRFTSMTSVDGIFAAGDVVDFRYRQAITAAGMGCAAGLDAERWLEQQN
jgi:thioredoxin reductase (NADPH)